MFHIQENFSKWHKLNLFITLNLKVCTIQVFWASCAYSMKQKKDWLFQKQLTKRKVSHINHSFYDAQLMYGFLVILIFKMEQINNFPMVVSPKGTWFEFTILLCDTTFGRNSHILLFVHGCTYMTTRFASREFSMTSSLNRKCRFVLSFIASNSASVMATAEKQEQ